jgi:hypothetical protein
MKQTRRQRAASLRNLRKARSARGGSRRRRRRSTNPAPRRRRRTTRRSKRRNSSSMPVVLVNPSASPRRRRSRANPSRKRRSRRRRGRVSVSRYQRRYPRIRNPAGTWGGSLLAWLLGSTGGAVAGGLDWGADYLPWPAWAQALTLGLTGSATSILVCRFADVRAGCGIAGGNTAMVLNRVRQIIALARTAPATSQPSTASAVMNAPGAGRVVGGNAGQMVRRTGARTMPAPAMASRSLKQAGEPTYPVRGTRFGPTSWVYGRNAGAVFVSAHDRRRQV